MSDINGKFAEDWIEENHPENGLFRVYWKDVKSVYSGGATLDPDEGEGLRYEWYYKDGKRADGISKGWYPSGQLKQTQTWKDGKENGLRTVWYENGQKREEGILVDGSGKYTHWYQDGQKSGEGTIKDEKNDGLWITWNKSGQKVWEGIYKDGKET
tara:strand:+ start:990 stop:1457 length:468 start_codon:yes stop_codon:yes gene_type:complete